jgi:cytochrome c biogenesis protein CcdA
MEIDLLNMGLAFIEGLALVASPCILPILPIILSASIEGSRKRPYGIILGFVLSFALFTFFSRQLVLLFGIDLNVVRNVSFGLLIFLGLIMISSYLTEKFNQFTQVFANIGFKASQGDDQAGFGSGVIFGALIGLIWTPCAGPILAAVIVQTILQHSNFSSFLTILAFAIGAAIPMLIIILFGRQLSSKFQFFENKAGLLRKLLGVIIIFAVLFMMYGPDLSTVSASAKVTANNLGDELEEGIKSPYKAPDPTGITSWVNSEPLTMEQLKGQVVLVDFWAYSCINCKRTIPYLLDWYKKYHDKGLEIIGVHAPEFDFERDLANVKNAVQQDQIPYPVALDNNFSTWQAYKNHYWPAHYLVDKEGNVVYEHFGEGDYDITENNIRFLLGIHEPMQAKVEAGERNIFETPETYLGYSRSNAYSSPETMQKDQSAIYSYPTSLHKNVWAIKGSWKINEQFISTEEKNAAIKINFNAKKVFAVMGSPENKTINVKVLLNDKELHDKTITVKGHNLYSVVELPASAEGIVELVADEPGLDIYTFTFGS